MRFITGPRRAGKTVLAKAMLEDRGTPELYFLWDQRSVRQTYKKDELFFTAVRTGSARDKWICFDEIHKMPKWKNILKSAFDSSGDLYRFIVTGSAKFDLSRRAGDSLSGRYFTFHLFPLLLGEVNGRSCLLDAPEKASDLVERYAEKNPFTERELSSLLEYGGFPEPFTMRSVPFLRKWSGDYMDTVIKEDIGALTNIENTENVLNLYELLPDMTGSPCSESSLSGDIGVSPPTIRRHLDRLEDFYLIQRLRPWFRNIRRSLLKSAKVYLFNWSAVPDPAKRFETYAAMQISAQISLWNDAGSVPFRLHYIRNRMKEEVDFLICRDKKPWLLIETKMSDGNPDGHLFRIQEELSGIPLLQVCREPGVCRQAGRNAWRISASKIY